MPLTPSFVGGSARVLVIGLALGVVVAMTGTAAAAPDPPGKSSEMFKEKVDGIFRAWPGNCPDELPSTPLVCTEWDLEVYKAGVNEAPGGVAPPHTPWVLVALHHTLTFAGDDSEPVESDAALGVLEGADVTFDQQHLSSASVRAPHLVLDDGSVVDLEADFTAFGPLQQWGNDGPALDEFGLVKHLHEKCVTLNSQGHQKFRLAHARAVVDGVESRYDGSSGFIADNQFIGIEVHPASCS